MNKIRAKYSKNGVVRNENILKIKEKTFDGVGMPTYSSMSEEKG